MSEENAGISICRRIFSQGNYSNIIFPLVNLSFFGLPQPSSKQKREKTQLILKLFRQTNVKRQYFQQKSLCRGQDLFGVLLTEDEMKSAIKKAAKNSQKCKKSDKKGKKPSIIFFFFWTSRLRVEKIMAMFLFMNLIRNFAF